MDKQAGSASIRGNRLALARRLGLLLLLTGALPAVNAQILQTPASEEQRRRSQAEALERQRRLQAPHVALPTDDAVHGLTVPTESPCFTYHRFALEVPPRLSHAHQLAGASDTWRNAFPTGPGQLLRRGDLEQGLEQMERIPSQTVGMRLVPAATPGDHDVVLSVGGVDHIVEVGGPGTLAQSVRAVRIGGHIALIGVLTGFNGEVPTAELLSKQARLQGLVVGSRRQQQEYVAALEQTGIRPIIHASVPLEQVADAFRLQERGEHFGKLVIEW